jgi:hypothetical protein
MARQAPLKYIFYIAGTPEKVFEGFVSRSHKSYGEWAEGDPTYAACADGWPRILSRLKTLLETGKTFKPH